ncbi:hypothetical protein T4A_7418 [Trichinella pseudospiralis]|uniref:Uncharacterized protein n=1 Tax=Trichinella pseudospiralis TaxID=6337 RepID=A0A0V1DTY1_TRIPS|nr:hypothetical protein T4A_7418 [Trichinella pseudospiralis]
MYTSVGGNGYELISHSKHIHTLDMETKKKKTETENKDEKDYAHTGHIVREPVNRQIGPTAITVRRQ